MELKHFPNENLEIFLILNLEFFFSLDFENLENF